MNRRESMAKTIHRERLGTVSKNILLEDLNQFHGANLALNSDVDQDTFWKVTKTTNTIAKRSVLSIDQSDLIAFCLQLPLECMRRRENRR